MGYKGRDVAVSLIGKDLCLVVACDSCGAIGNKPLDQLRVPPELVGQLTSRLTLMEVLCTGARPRVMTVAISSEPEPTGRRILEGVRAELEAAGFKDLALAISTEKNYVPDQTGLGIGLTGTCRIQDLRIAVSKPDDRVFCLGMPRVGKEVADASGSQIIGTRHIRELLATAGVHELVPIGSRGIRAEAEQLAGQVNTRFVPECHGGPDLDKSAGPSTCAIFTCTPDETPGPRWDLPVSRVGTLAPL